MRRLSVGSRAYAGLYGSRGVKPPYNKDRYQSNFFEKDGKRDWKSIEINWDEPFEILKMLEV